MILIVEDNKALRLMIKKALEKEGYIVNTASNPKKGLSLLNEQLPDLIISDVVMPEMDGFDLLKKIKKEYSSIPFLLLTIKSNLEDYSKGYELGATDYITKPFEMQTLIKKVHKRLDSHHLMKEIIEGNKKSISLDKIKIFDLLHNLKNAGIDCILNISSTSGEGKFKIKNGEIEKAEFSGLKGKEAISKLGGLNKGEIKIERK